MSSNTKKRGGIRTYKSKSKSKQQLDKWQQRIERQEQQDRQLEERQQERQELYQAQQQRVAARFPTSTKIKLNTEQRIDRLEALSATYLAFMDRMLEIWESRKCPFVDEQDKHLPEPDKDQQQQQPNTTIEDPAAASTKPDIPPTTGNHSPYH